MATVRPYRKTAAPTRAQAPQVDSISERDENGLTPWHYFRGRQVLCGTCDQRPCADRCPKPWEPDTLKRKAARANLTIEQWAAAHPDWIGWTLHAEREDVATFLAALSSAVGQEVPEEAQAQRRIPVGAAMEQAMAVMAGRVQAEDVAPVYEEVR